MVQAGASFGLGRFDQYMYPFYQKDILEGRLTKERAQELIECLWVKNAEVIPMQSASQARYLAGYPVNQDITIGGLTREGKDATNELSYMCPMMFPLTYCLLILFRSLRMKLPL